MPMAARTIVLVTPSVTVNPPLLVIESRIAPLARGVK